MKQNDIGTRPSQDLIIIQGKERVYYGPSDDSSQAIARRVETILCRSPQQNQVIMPGEFFDVSIPDAPADRVWAVEPRVDCHVNKGKPDDSTWPQPQVVQAVDDSIRLVNSENDPIYIKKNQHVCQVTLVNDWSDSTPAPLLDDSSRVLTGNNTVGVNL